MASNVEMKACPHCGTLLLASLVDAINDPSQPESCWRFSEVKTEWRITQDKFEVDGFIAWDMWTATRINESEVTIA